MATTKSTNKILEYLDKQEAPVTKTELVKSCHLPFSSVNDILQFLQSLNQIQIWTNGHITLVKLNSGEKNG